MFRFITAGESHGQCLTAIIEGLPAGIEIDTEKINGELARRQQGFGRGGRMGIEKDRAEIVSGVRFGQTLGSPVTLVIKNKDWANWQDRMAVSGLPGSQAVTAPRPGHADLPGALKYGHTDIRNIIERASARETAARVAVGAIARQVVALGGMMIASHVINIGGINIEQQDLSFDRIAGLRSESELGCVDSQAEAKMKAAISSAQQTGDSLGGVFEVIATGMLPGLGSHVHWDRRLDTKLAGALMSIPAIKGVEIGAGFGYAKLSGKQAHDEIFYDPAKGYYRQSNQAGGLEGGITNGENLVLRAVMKPIPTLMSPLRTVDITTRQPVQAIKERSDVCAVPAAAVVGEAMIAIVLADAFLEKFGGDSAGDLQAAVDLYRRRLARW